MAKYIGNQPAFGEFKKLDSLVSSFNGSTTQFNLEYNGVGHTIGDATQLIVSLNGIVQEPLTSYTLGVGGGIIVFSTAPASTDTCHIVSLGGVGSTGTVADGAVTASKLDASLKDYLEETYTADGTQTTYTLTRAALGSNSLMLSIDGIVQPSTAFSVSGTTLTISPALPNTTNVRVVHMGVQSGVFVPANNSITAAQIGSLGANLVFDDNSKAVFGEGSDLQIYHDGTNSYIKDAGIGELYIQGDESIRFTNAAGSETLARFISQNRVDLYYDNAIKLSTTSTGVDITGTLTSDGLTVDGDGKITTSSGIGLQLHNSSSNQSYLQFTNSATGESSANGFQIGIDGSEEGLIWHYKNEPIKFATNNTEAMRIDSSGHLLVGQSASNTPGVGNTTNGHSLRSDGLFFSSAYQGRTGTFGRNGNDGPVLGIYKDGANAGDFGVKIANSQARLYLGNSNTKILFDNGADRIYPVNNDGDARNGAIDLGLQGAAFKDLYLTGGIQFDSRSNKLDDYEEGTWTPGAKGASSSNTATVSSGTEGSYVKIGNQVTVNFIVVISSLGSATGPLQITGLPFTIADILVATGIEANGTAGYWQGFATGINNLVFTAEGNTNLMYAYGTTSGTQASISNITIAQMGTAALRGSISYRTT